MVVTFLVIAVLVSTIPFTASYALVFAAIGIIFGPAGGLIMALPAQVLHKDNRAMGMGIFYTIYYAGMGIFPAIAGYTRDTTGNPAAPFFIAAIAIILAILALIGFQIVKTRQAGDGVMSQ